MTDYLPRFRDGHAVTFTASAPVTGGRLVALTGGRTIGPAGADSPVVVGVAGFDALLGEKVTVYTRAGGVHQLVAASAIAVGAKISSAADGKVATGGDNPVGIALTPAAGNLSTLEVLFT